MSRRIILKPKFSLFLFSEMNKTKGNDRSRRTTKTDKTNPFVSFELLELYVTVYTTKGMNKYKCCRMQNKKHFTDNLCRLLCV